MATNYGGTAEKKQVPLAVVIIAAVVVLIFVGWLGYRSFGPPAPVAKDAKTLQREAGWDALAKKSGGDISRLTPEEQQKLNQETGGHGGAIIKQMAEQNGYK